MLMLHARNEIKKFGVRWLTNSLPKVGSVQVDHVQTKSFQEKCILVNETDQVIGTATKEECHRVQKDGSVLLHRAFSVFCFNEHGHMLVQKRSPTKITFPNFYSNACCSHPLSDYPGETVEADAVGIKRAAQRRLNYELGIDVKDIPIENIHYLTRIHYFDSGNGIWGEHEMDYILFFKGRFKINPNSDEISQICYVPKEKINSFVTTLDGPLTPWFRYILNKQLLIRWWDNLNDLSKFEDHKTIHKQNILN